MIDYTKSPFEKEPVSKQVKVGFRGFFEPKPAQSQAKPATPIDTDLPDLDTLLTQSVVAVDIGNSDIKFGLFSGGELKKTWRASDIIPNEDYQDASRFSAKFRSSLAVLGTEFDGLVFSSVVPQVEASLKQTLQYCFPLKHPPLAFRLGMTQLPIQIENYPLDQLGSDRVAACCGAELLYPKTAKIVVDFGTATTFNVVDEQGRFLGGAIAPGLETFTNILNAKTAKLPRTSFKQPISILGCNTQDCLDAGIYWGYRGLVESILAQIKVEFFKAPEADEFNEAEPPVDITALYEGVIDFRAAQELINSVQKESSGLASPFKMNGNKAYAIDETLSQTTLPKLIENWLSDELTSVSKGMADTADSQEAFSPKPLKAPFITIATGGNAETFLAATQEVAIFSRYEPALTLRGLYAIWQGVYGRQS